MKEIIADQIKMRQTKREKDSNYRAKTYVGCLIYILA